MVMDFHQKVNYQKSFALQMEHLLQMEVLLPCSSHANSAINHFVICIFLEWKPTCVNYSKLSAKNNAHDFPGNGKQALLSTVAKLLFT